MIDFICRNGIIDVLFGSQREGLPNVFSHVQIRGSSGFYRVYFRVFTADYPTVPLFWDQQGYGLKPAPQFSPNRSHAENLDACRRHLARTVAVYGPHVSFPPLACQIVQAVNRRVPVQTIVNLAEQHGKEATVTNGYRDHITELKSEDIQ